VTLTCAAPAGHALIGRVLYLPADWAADEERRDLAGAPDEVMFATKPQLAGTLLRQAPDRGSRAGFIAGDEVYGRLDLRKSIRGHGTGYVLTVRSNHMVTLPSGRRLTVKAASGLVKPAIWQRMRTGSEDYCWAMIAIAPDDTPEGHDDGHAVPFAALIKVAVTRWKIEEDHQVSKQVAGLDAGQVTTWTSWHRWTAMARLRRRTATGGITNYSCRIMLGLKSHC
jgi:SRSO17 transposase